MGTAGIVLCGGKSSRMGRAKAWLPWCGRPLVAHVVSVLSKVVDEVVVVTSEQLELPPLDARVIRDREPELGPLAGIRDGLEQTRSDRAFVTATDAPFLSSAFVEAMLAHDGAVAAEIDGHVQTLAAVYPRCGAGVADEMLAEGRGRPLELLERLRYRRIPASELPDVASVRGFNTPDEYLAAVRSAGGTPTAVVELFGAARAAVGRREIEVSIGTLDEVLDSLRPRLDVLVDGVVANSFSVSLAGTPLHEGSVPIGPDERVSVQFDIDTRETP